jgi:oxygen-independent coproporphyrinogen-3 oxidase
VDEGTIRSRYGVDVWERFGTELARSVDAGLLVREGGRLRLTRAGMLLANEVMSVFV